MLNSTIHYRILYADTDQMGVVYYGNYARMYEMGRAEMVRELGYTYKEMEDSGVLMPIVKVEAKYHKSLYYDELATIITSVSALPAVRIVFHHEIFNEKNELAHTADVTLAFLDMKRYRPVRAPERLMQLLKENGDF